MQPLRPRVGTEEGHCTYFYPSVPLRITDLVNGYDAIQFAVGQGTTFWGHMLVDNAAIRVALTNGHPDVRQLGLGDFTARLEVQPLSAREGFAPRLHCPSRFMSQIAAVHFQGWYDGYDENGNRKRLDWHGFTKARQPTAWLGRGEGSNPSVAWDTAMLPAQKDVAVRAAVWFKANPGLVFLTPATIDLEIPERADAEVVLLAPHDLPVPFWSYATARRSDDIELRNTTTSSQ